MNSEIRITTTQKFDNVEILKYFNPITAHVVIGMNIFKDFLSSLTDIVGGNSQTYEKTLEDINNEAINKLIEKAKILGANSILNLRIENNEISSKDKSMLMVTAIGTAAYCDFEQFDIETSKKINLIKEHKNELLIQQQKQEKIQKEKQEEELIKEYNIIYKDEHYHLGEYKYSNLKDAINYAEILRNK